GRCGREEFADRNHQGAGEPHEHIRAWIRLGELDASDVLVVQAGQFGEPFLRELSLEPEPTQLTAERTQDGRPRTWPSGRYSSARHIGLCTALAREGEPSIVGIIVM